MSEKKGSSIWERPVNLIPLDQPHSEADAEMLREHLLSLNGLDQRLSLHAARCEAIVSSMSSDPLKRTPMQQAAKKWLSVYQCLCRARSNADEQQTVELSYWLGELSEELRWKWGFVPGLKASPEELALVRKKAMLALATNNEGRDEANSKRARAKTLRREYAQEKAKEYRTRKLGSTETEIALYIHRIWNLAEEEKPAVSTIRNYLRK